MDCAQFGCAQANVFLGVRTKQMTIKTNTAFARVGTTPIEPTDPWRNPLARALQKHLQRAGKSIYQLSNDSGIDAAYIWRVLNNKKNEVSREVLILLSIAFIVDDDEVDAIAEVANDLLDAAGYKTLRQIR